MDILKYNKVYVSGDLNGRVVPAVMNSCSPVHEDYIRNSSPTNLRTQFNGNSDTVGSEWYATDINLIINNR
jgi:hypothetical protein